MIGLVVAVGQVEPAQWIDVLLLNPRGLSKAKVAFLIVDRGDRVVGEGVGLNATKGAVGSDVVVLSPVDVQVLSHRDHILNLLGRVETKSVPLVVGLFATDHTVLIPIIKRDIGVVARSGDSVVDHLSGIENRIHPIGTGGKGISKIGEAQHVERRGLVAVGKLFTHQNHIVFGSEHFGKLPRLRIEVARGVGDALAAFAAVFGGDDHNTIGRTGTVNGTGSGVFQNVNRLYIARVQVVNVSHLQTIHDIQR